MSVAKTSGAKRKKMGRPVTTGKTPITAIRLHPQKLAEVRRWGNEHGAKSVSEAVRMMIDTVLAMRVKRK
jgi:hypothetical protein